jgi:hypothetical protein
MNTNLSSEAGNGIVIKWKKWPPLKPSQVFLIQGTLNLGIWKITALFRAPVDEK